jgi:hypothetical protein
MNHIAMQHDGIMQHVAGMPQWQNRISVASNMIRSCNSVAEMQHE